MLISVPKLWGFVTAILTASLIYLFFQKTRMGRAIRATSLDREAASLMGINQYKVYNVAFGIGTATAGIAAVTLVASCPTGVNAPLIAIRLGTGQALASNVLVISTAAAVVTTAVWLTLVYGLIE